MTKMDEVMIKCIKALTYKEFKDYCEESDANIVKKFDRRKFELKCKKCKSDAVIVNTLKYDIAGGCPTCGSWLEGEGAIIIKCPECGSAMTIITAEENEDI